MPESDKHGDKGQITLIRNLKNIDDVRTMDVIFDDCKKILTKEYNLSKSICVKRGATWETNEVNTFINLKINF